MIYHCPFLQGVTDPVYDRDSEERKPRPGMLLRAVPEMDSTLPIRR